MTPFNKPHLTGKESHYMYQAVQSGKLSGNGDFTKKCQKFFEDHYGFQKCLLTSSCTDALEMAAILLNIQPGDEVIIPSYTFVSTANAFVLRGAKIVFVDSHINQPNLNEALLEELITPKTKAIVPVHYAGVACNMEAILALAKKYNIIVVEDAAQAIDSYFTFSDGTQKALGSMGHLATFSFHETKNIISGEGGMLAINDEQFIQRAEIIWEKGTNRAAFWRGDVDKYGWVDVGSSFLPSEITAAFLWAQIEEIDAIQNQRKFLWNTYQTSLKPLEDEGLICLPKIPDYGGNNAHMFYLITKTADQRQALLAHLKEQGVHAVFHYLSLHKSPFMLEQNNGSYDCPQSDFYTDNLFRLPLYFDLHPLEQKHVISTIFSFFQPS